MAGEKGTPGGAGSSPSRKPSAPQGQSGSQTVRLAKKGVSTGQEFAALMSALMSDVIEGKIDAATANAACNAGGKLLKVVEMGYKYASSQPQKQERVLVLSPDTRQSP